MAEANRPKRRCARSKANMPSAVHYVGYVEDEETPEMIMKKFEELEKVINAPAPLTAPTDAVDQPADQDGDMGIDDDRDQAGQRSTTHAQASTSTATGAAGDGPPGGLSEHQLMQVFRQTSIFNVKTLLQNNEVLMGADRSNLDETAAGGAWSADDFLSSDEDDGWEYLRGFWSDDDGQPASAAHRKRNRHRGRGDRPPRPPRGPAADRPQPRHRHAIVTQFNRDTNAFIRRKVRVLDRDALVQLRIPAPPLPPSWGRIVRPLLPPSPHPPPQPTAPSGAAGAGDGSMAVDGAAAANGCAAGAQERGGGGGGGSEERAEAVQVAECGDITEFDYTRLGGKRYQALLINPGWDAPAGGGGKAVPADSGSIGRLAELALTKLCPIGFIFIWAEKEQISGICRHLASHGYSYVENLTWVYLHHNNSILRLPHSLSQRSHITLLIFRRDVEEGRAIELRHQRSPDVIFDCIRYAEGTRWQVPDEVFASIETMLPQGRGSFLQLWAARNCRRPGWDHLIEAPTTTA